eukprot:908460-Pleurochrysis_carterae.AAC.1
MTRAELEAAYKRAVQQRNYAWRQVRRQSKPDAAAKSASMRNIATERADASEKAIADCRYRLYKIPRDAMTRRPAADH